MQHISWRQPTNDACSRGHLGDARERVLGESATQGRESLSGWTSSTQSVPLLWRRVEIRLRVGSSPTTTDEELLIRAP